MNQIVCSKCIAEGRSNVVNVVIGGGKIVVNCAIHGDIARINLTGSFDEIPTGLRRDSGS